MLDSFCVKRLLHNFRRKTRHVVHTVPIMNTGSNLSIIICLDLFASFVSLPLTRQYVSDGYNRDLQYSPGRNPLKLVNISLTMLENLIMMQLPATDAWHYNSTMTWIWCSLIKRYARMNKKTEKYKKKTKRHFASYFYRNRFVLGYIIRPQYTLMRGVRYHSKINPLPYNQVHLKTFSL